MEVVANIIGIFIKKNRERLKLTQAELGKALGYRYGNFIGYLENGKAVFPLDKWEEYAQVLQVEKHVFLEIILQEKYPSMMPYMSFHSLEENQMSEPHVASESA